MGNSCSHNSFSIIQIDPDVYRDDDVWKYKVGDIKCNECNTILRGIKKTCIDHDIEQEWEILYPVNCSHTIANIINKKYDPSKSMYTATLECAYCKLTIPIYKDTKNNNWITKPIK